MESLNVAETLARAFEDNADPRTNPWFLVGSFRHIYVILIVYIVFCLQLGPWLMRDRKPFELKALLIAYNVTNIAISLYVVCEGLLSGWGWDYSLTCQPVDFSVTPQALRMARVVWVYYMAKVFDLLDTVLFVLRKKTNQITFLHMIHHTTITLTAFICTRYFPGGHGTMVGLLNSLVHVVMYSYYLVAALGPQYQKYLWWKKYITIMQMIQFVMVFLHNSQLMFRECNFPKGLAFLICVWSILFFKMFFDFYVTTYIRKPNKS